MGIRRQLPEFHTDTSDYKQDYFSGLVERERAEERQHNLL